MQIKISRTAVIQQNPNINSYHRLQILTTPSFHSARHSECKCVYEKLFMFSIEKILYRTYSIQYISLHNFWQLAANSHFVRNCGIMRSANQKYRNKRKIQLGPGEIGIRSIYLNFNNKLNLWLARTRFKLTTWNF